MAVLGLFSWIQLSFLSLGACVCVCLLLSVLLAVSCAPAKPAPLGGCSYTSAEVQMLKVRASSGLLGCPNFPMCFGKGWAWDPDLISSDPILRSPWGATTEWEILERKAHPEGVSERCPTPPGSQGVASPQIQLSLSCWLLWLCQREMMHHQLPPRFPCFPVIEGVIPREVSSLKLAGESLREEFLSQVTKEMGFQCRRCPTI